MLNKFILNRELLFYYLFEKKLFKLCFYFLLTIYKIIFLLYIYSINNITKNLKLYLILFFEELKYLILLNMK